MIISTNRQSERGYIIEIILAIIVIVGFAYVFFKVARCLKHINPNPVGTNDTSLQIGYETNYGGNILVAPISASPLETEGRMTPEGTSVGPSFTFTYCVCPAGMCRVLANSATEYKLMLNMTTNLVVMDFQFDQYGGYLETDTTNSPMDAVILKSTNMLDWQQIGINQMIDPGEVYSFTDTNATEQAAFYQAKPVTP